uniref:Uncharacterized protein n=1 Tax=Cucumis sativus TaxID=3659 RepID=A0A0A0LKM1_CUCSA
MKWSSLFPTKLIKKTEQNPPPPHNANNSWLEICEAIQSTFSSRCTINPFLDNKTLIHVYDTTVAQFLYNHEDWESIRKFNLHFLDASLISSYLCQQTASYGGWIDVFDLPPILWNE